MKKKFIYLGIFVFFVIALLIISSTAIKSFFSDVSNVKEFVLSFGVWSPIIFILFQIAQVLIAPIPGQLVGFIGGYLFGVWMGTIYSITGMMIGTLIIVYLVRKFGEPFVKKMVDEKTYKKFDKFCKDDGLLALFLIYLLPFFPDDVLSFIAGLSNLKLRNILLVAFIGRLPGVFGLSLIGAGIAESDATLAIVIMSILTGIAFIAYLYRIPLEKKMTAFLNKFKDKKKA
jgi:uncharacterized membrane protein YdjX (TVP38/TMEM64 family)